MSSSLSFAAKVLNQLPFNASASGKAASGIDLELEAVRQSSLVRRGIERFERSTRPVAPVPPTVSAPLTKLQPQSLETLVQQPAEVPLKAPYKLPEVLKGWRQWFQLPYLPLID